MPSKCPRCESPKPELHPAMQFEGEVQPCRHPWHEPKYADEFTLSPKDREELAGECHQVVKYLQAIADGGDIEGWKPSYEQMWRLSNAMERWAKRLREGNDG